jgi:hypothetical protein
MKAAGALLYTAVAGLGFTIIAPPLGVTLVVMSLGTSAYLTLMEQATRPRYA